MIFEFKYLFLYLFIICFDFQMYAFCYFLVHFFAEFLVISVGWTISYWVNYVLQSKFYLNCFEDTRLDYPSDSPTSVNLLIFYYLVIFIYFIELGWTISIVQLVHKYLFKLFYLYIYINQRNSDGLMQIVQPDYLIYLIFFIFKQNLGWTIVNCPTSSIFFSPVYMRFISLVRLSDCPRAQVLTQLISLQFIQIGRAHV